MGSWHRLPGPNLADQRWPSPAPLAQIDRLVAAIEEWQLTFQGNLEALGTTAPPDHLVRWYAALGGSLRDFHGSELFNAALSLADLYLAAATDPELPTSPGAPGGPPPTPPGRGPQARP